MLVHLSVHIIHRIGLSGELAPRHVIPSTVSMKPYGEVREIERTGEINYNILILFLRSSLHF